MGDKTQFLAVALAAKYNWKAVLGGIVLAVFLLMGIAVLFGNYLLSLLPEFILKMVAGCLFLFFGVYSLLQKSEKEESVKNRLSPFWATFATFFLSELGDKTQLLTMALSAEYRSPILVWLGASSAMVLVDGLAVFLGNRLGKIVPVRTLSIVAGVLFLAFGVLTILSIFFPFLSF